MNKPTKHPFFLLSAYERTGTIALLLLIVFIWFLPDLYLHFFQPPLAELNYTDHSDSWLQKSEHEKAVVEENNSNQVAEKSIALKPFDPNTATESDWISMGLKPQTAQTIGKYLAHGGKFKTANDLRKIWGMPTSLCEKIMPFVNINNQFPKHESAHWKDTGNLVKKSNQRMPISINQADSAAWESLPGIGPALAHRIVAYREKLGGFVQTEQLKEVWNLPDSVYQKIKNRLLTDEKIVKIQLNTAGFEDFRKHPYFGYRLAKIIVNYREQHGLFHSLEDIQKIVLIDENQYKKIIPYLTIY
jgi:competence ComEA-like helix-hairpin-helix protein